MKEEEIDELLKDFQHLRKELGKFLGKWRGKIFKPLEKALEMLETWL